MSAWGQFTYIVVSIIQKQGDETMLKTATVEHDGLVTLPESIMNEAGLSPGSSIEFEIRGNEIVIKALQPMSAYMGILKGYDLGDIEPPKEPDKDYE
jgi:bifunctional DNA-binding transcriptional regulator/antitoxin component of YhaV-PrlF toxin-antitoxin module